MTIEYFKVRMEGLLIAHFHNAEKARRFTDEWFKLLEREGFLKNDK